MVSRYLREVADGTVIVLKIPTIANFADVHTKAVSQVVFNTLSPFIVCKIENLWLYYEHYYSKDILWTILFYWHFMLYVVKLCERYYSDLDDMSQVSLCALWNRGSVNVKFGIVQVKLRFHGGTRGKERVVLCFDWVFKSVTDVSTTTF